MNLSFRLNLGPGSRLSLLIYIIHIASHYIPNMLGGLCFFFVGTFIFSHNCISIVGKRDLKKWQVLDFTLRLIACYG